MNLKVFNIKDLGYIKIEREEYGLLGRHNNKQPAPPIILDSRVRTQSFEFKKKQTLDQNQLLLGCSFKKRMCKAQVHIILLPCSRHLQSLLEHSC